MSSITKTYMDAAIRDANESVVRLSNFYDTMLSASIDEPTRICRIPLSDFFTRYSKELARTIQYYNLAERYFYQPKTLSLELYGTTELWLSLLRVNHMTNVTEFHLPIIQIYNPIELKELIQILFKRERKLR